jgi:predicted RNase H-like HicB family nuclease
MTGKRRDAKHRGVERRFYPAVVEKGEDGFSVYFPDLPGCSSGGDTIPDAIGAAHEALALHVAGILEEGLSLPKATKLADVGPQPSDVDVVAVVLIGVTLPGSTKVVQLKLDTNLLAEIDEASTNHSQFIAGAARAELLRRSMS